MGVRAGQFRWRLGAIVVGCAVSLSATVVSAQPAWARRSRTTYTCTKGSLIVTTMKRAKAESYVDQGYTCNPTP
jgi:hypothetical protein